MALSRHRERVASLRALRAAAGGLEERGDAAGAAAVRALALQPLIHLERYEDARKAGRRCLETYGRLGDRQGLIRTRMALADLASRLDRPREALVHYSAVDALLDSNAPPRLLAALAANRANALVAR